MVEQVSVSSICTYVPICTVLKLFNIDPQITVNVSELITKKPVKNFDSSVCTGRSIRNSSKVVKALFINFSL